MDGPGQKSDGSLASPSFLRELEEAKLTALAEFAAGAGHEINNPLAIISGRAQLLLEKATSSDERRHLAVIIAQARRAYEMIADLRLFSRPPEPILASMDLKSFFDDIESDFTRYFPNQRGKVSVVWESTPNGAIPSSVLTDSKLLRAIFDALIQNASEAVDGQDVLIFIHIRFQSKQLIFIVEDNGPGISTEIRGQIFSPYFSGRNHGRGLGFGLPRSWAYARKLGGNLYLDATSSDKARFILEIPAE